MANKRKTSKPRNDGWGNVYTKLGDRLRDKRFGASLDAFSFERITDEDAETIWRGDPLGARVVEIPPGMMLRNGFKVRVADLEPTDPNRQPYAEVLDSLDELDEHRELEEAIKNTCDELGIVGTMIEALEWERAYGGCALLLGADDGQRDLSKPINLKTLRAIRYLIPCRPRELQPRTWNGNPDSAGYGKPVTWLLQRETGAGVSATQQIVHSSRLLIFPGKVTSRRMTSERNSWGDSIFVRLHDVLRDYNGSHDAVPVLLTDFSQAVHKVKGLAELLAADEDDLVRKRLEQLELGRSIVRAAVIDAEDDLTRTVTPTSGLPELLDRVSKRFAAAAGIPASLLFGEAPAGLNATGEVNERWFSDELQGQRETKIRPRLNRLMRLILRSSEGPTKGVEPAKWIVHFGPLSQPSQLETADTRLKTAQADEIYLTAQVLAPEEVALSRFGGDEWSGDTRLDLEARRAMAAAGVQPGLDPNADPEDPKEEPEPEDTPPEPR